MTPNKKPTTERLAESITGWIGTPQSIIVHTFFFLGIFALTLFGLHLDDVLLALTTLLSIEAIYLALFIQMTVNKTTESLEDVEEDIDDIEKDIDTIQKDEKNDDVTVKRVADTLSAIEQRLSDVQKDLQSLKQKGVL